MPHGLAYPPPPTPPPFSLHVCLDRTRNAFAGRLPVAAFVARNCLQHRNEAVTGLVKAGLEVHSLGQCTPPGTQKHPLGTDNKIAALKGYAVYLAFENSDSDDYVSEKVPSAQVICPNPTTVHLLPWQ